MQCILKIVLAMVALACDDGEEEIDQRFPDDEPAAALSGLPSHCGRCAFTAPVSAKHGIQEPRGHGAEVAPVAHGHPASISMRSRASSSAAASTASDSALALEKHA